MSVLSYQFHSLLLKLPNKGISFSFPLLKLPNRGIKEFSKMILFIPFYSIQFLPPKQSLGFVRFRDLGFVKFQFPIISFVSFCNYSIFFLNLKYMLDIKAI